MIIRMSSRSQELIYQLAGHIALLHSDQADILGHFVKLEDLIEDYRTFLTSLTHFTNEHEQQQQITLLQRTHELLGERLTSAKDETEQAKTIN